MGLLSEGHRQIVLAQTKLFRFVNLSFRTAFDLLRGFHRAHVSTVRLRAHRITGLKVFQQLLVFFVVVFLYFLCVVVGVCVTLATNHRLYQSQPLPENLWHTFGALAVINPLPRVSLPGPCWVPHT